MATPRRSSNRSPRLFKKILIANRGEIAVRVMRGCRQLGISPVAVFSEADRHALHARTAEEAYFIGASPAPSSYLNIESILAAARKSGAEAIHPGYGFLAESPDFAQACKDAKLVFIGPGPQAMRRLGNKIQGKKRMAAAGVPVVPGLEKKQLSVDELRQWAKRVGYPILLKAAAGGGGRGMRIVREPEEVAAALATARSEAAGAFGDDTVFAEKYLEGARHIEVQVLVDKKGKGISLGERECSIQRRHQKLVEETPSPVVDVTTRKKLGRYALKACQAAGYTNAGTVEFLRDKDGRFYFLEMNARLQVEHPITEIVTGVDLVQAQIHIAAGAALPVPSTSLQPRGWAIECRIQAEDPEDDFRPSPGKIRYYRPPSAPRVRVDGGVTAGDEVSLYYDSLLAKLIAWGPSRAQAIETMALALSEFRITGVRTTIPFHRQVMQDEEFLSGEIDTDFIGRFRRRPRRKSDPDMETAALVAAAHLYQSQAARKMVARVPSSDSWTRAGRQAQTLRAWQHGAWRNR